MSEQSTTDYPIDLNKIYTDLAEKIINNTTSAILDKGKGMLKNFGENIRLQLMDSYKSYLPSVYQRYSNSKSFLIRDESVNLHDFYVPTGISNGRKNIESVSIFNFSVNSRFAVIEGSAGSGKSMMMRYLCLNCIEKEEKIPIFIELRRINDFDGTLLEFIENTLKENDFTLDLTYIMKALRAGHFAIFLDGFDEISTSKRKETISEIQRLARQYKQNLFIISSRLDEEFSCWERCDVWKISPLTLEQAINLVRKIPAKNIEIDTKKKFLKDLESHLYEKHESFLSNPLLLSIMTITYANSGDVPEKISTFYENAYITLYEKHDALKGSFRRDRKCNLDILDFKKVFAAFSALSASNRINDSNRNSLRFPKTEVLDLINSAKKIVLINNEFKAEDFFNDCLKAVCLFVEDGLEITFVHRSFQEYFTAIFIVSLDDTEIQKTMISTYLKASGRDDTINLLHELNSSLVEKLVLIPAIEKLENSIGYKGETTNIVYKNFMEYTFCSRNSDLQSQQLLVMPNNDTEETQLWAWVFKFIVYKYFKIRFLGTFHSETSKRLIANGVHEQITLSKALTNQYIMEIIGNDETTTFSKNTLTKIFRFKEELIEKHKQVEYFRNENLLSKFIK